MGADIRRKGKIEKVTEFAKRMKKVQEEAKVVLKKAQKEMKYQVDKRKREVEKQKKDNKVILSMKDLVFKKRPVKKLVNQYVSPYINEVVSTNAVKL